MAVMERNGGAESQQPVGGSAIWGSQQGVGVLEEEGVREEELQRFPCCRE